MAKITFMGAGSSVFAKNILGDAMLTPALCDAHIALYDIDGTRLKESKKMLDTINANCNKKRAKITAHLGAQNRKAALKGANYVVNAIQVGGYEPSTVIDFEIPKKYGLRQTIADTLGIGGIFRALRTIPVMDSFAKDMQGVCPDALMLNYTNPMAMLSGYMLRHTGIKYVGLCHSVQDCARSLCSRAGIDSKTFAKFNWKIAGINHMGWLLEIKDGDTDLYPMLRKKLYPVMDRVIKKGCQAVKDDPKSSKQEKEVAHDIIRLEYMRKFGYYVTESSEHNAEYAPFWIKADQPELIAKYAIPLDEYPRRCIGQIEGWKKQSKELIGDSKLSHTRGHEYGSYIMEAMETNVPFAFGGNIINNGLISNLPAEACVEVKCLTDRQGVHGTYVGALPEICAAMNRTNINPQLLTIEAAATLRKDAIYHAAFLDPHTAAELNMDQIKNLCDDLIKAHGNMLPKYK